MSSDEMGLKPDSELMRLIDSFFSSNVIEKDNELIYHYTTWGGLKGIIENRSLWFTEYKFLNDVSEINYAVGYFGDNIFSADQEDDRHMFYGAQDNLLNHESCPKPFYIASMCRQKNYLPAWRLYADDGAGFSIGFSRKKIQQGWYNPSKGTVLFEGIFGDVYYTGRSNISDEEKAKFKELNKYYQKIKNDERKNAVFRLAIRSLFPLVKHKCYEEEKEIRLGCSNFCYEGNPTGQESEIFYRNSENSSFFCNSVSYIKRPIALDWIVEIWCGPRAHEKHAEQEIKKLLSISSVGLANEHSIKVYFSRLPYKNAEKWGGR